MADFNEPVAGLGVGLSEAQAALEAFAQGPARQAAQSVASDFSRAGAEIARALGQAATRGEASFRSLAKTALEALAQIALDRLFPKAGAGGGGGIDLGAFFGARAAGGAVLPGGAYLVGERGPELFTPGRAGEITPAGAGGAVTVNLNFSGGADAESFRRDRGQIAAAVARAVAHGRRNL